MMNLHHVELFFHVVNHQGLSRAAGHLPFRIGLSALSEQILQLEACLGARLFIRRPFRLTAKGHQLYKEIRPLFESLTALSNSFGDHGGPRLRVGGPDALIGDCFPRLIPELRAVTPALRLTCVQGRHEEIETALAEHRVDVALTFLGRHKPARVCCRSLLKLPLVLFVPRASPVRSAADFWDRRTPRERLICPDATSPISATFHSTLRQAGLNWEPTLETDSLTAVADYVAAGQGVGLSVDAPWSVAPASLSAIRLLRLPGIPPVELATLWPSPGSAPVLSLVSLLSRQAPRWSAGARVEREQSCEKL